jgi:hypothetical protein
LAGNSSDGYFRPDVHAAFRTDDGEALLVRCSGLIEQTPAFHESKQKNGATDWDDQYMRVMQFDISFATSESGRNRNTARR